MLDAVTTDEAYGDIVVLRNDGVMVTREQAMEAHLAAQRDGRTMGAVVAGVGSIGTGGIVASGLRVGDLSAFIGGLLLIGFGIALLLWANHRRASAGDWVPTGR